MVVTRIIGAILALLVLVGCGSSVMDDPQFPSEPEQGDISGLATEYGIPKSISIPNIGAQSTLIETGVNPDGTIEVPNVNTPKQASWYNKSPRPGEIGPSVILGHVDGNKQKGIFFRLRDLSKNDVVVISTDTANISFRVDKVIAVKKSKFPTQQVYGDVSTPQLRLITCGGVFDKNARSYEDNIIVFASMVSAK